MKKVLVLAAAIALLATPALAQIKHTAHDLSTYQENAEICVFCHTPHGADTAKSIAPLWNRTFVDATTELYTSATLNATLTTNGINETDAPLCLSCHDGSSLQSDLVNAPNSGATWGTNYPATWSSEFGKLGTDLSDDHPIGFSYSTVQGLDSGLNATPANGIKFFDDGTITDAMWCSSCHSVHSDANSPFLRMSNVGSALCLECHNK